MAMEVRDAGSAVEAWLRGEHTYRVDKFMAAFGQDPEKKANYIMDTELADKWLRVVMFRRENGYHQSNQQMLKVTAAARALHIYDAQLRGYDLLDASERTFTLLHDFFRDISRADVPVEASFDEPRFEAVFEGKNRQNLIFAAAALSVTAALQTERIFGKLLLPKPGSSSRDIELLDPFSSEFLQSSPAA
jgi:hypothetical protein